MRTRTGLLVVVACLSACAHSSGLLDRHSRFPGARVFECGPWLAQGKTAEDTFNGSARTRELQHCRFLHVESGCLARVTYERVTFEHGVRDAKARPGDSLAQPLELDEWTCPAREAEEILLRSELGITLGIHRQSQTRP